VHQSTPGAFEKEGLCYKEVQDIRAKDKVLALNEKTGEERHSVVKQTFIRQADKIYHLTYEDGTLIETTWSHPFYIRGKGRQLEGGSGVRELRSSSSCFREGRGSGTC
jgi:hypothetical protein